MAQAVLFDPQLPGQASFNHQAQILTDESVENGKIKDCAPDPFDGMTIVTATCSSERDSRVPVVLQAIRMLGSGLSQDNAVPLKYVMAEWGKGLTEEDRRLIYQAAQAAGIPVSFTKVSPDHKSAGHSFNEGVRSLGGSQGKIKEWVMKLDDDSIAPADLPRKLAHMIHHTDADLIGGWDVRTGWNDNLADPQQIQALLEREESRCTNVSEAHRWNDVASSMTHDGKFSLAKLYTTYSFGLTAEDPICPNENGLLINPSVINRFAEKGKGLFIPEFPSGEGAALFALLAHLDSAKVVVDRKSYVLDRPCGGLLQEFVWGKGDAEFALTLKRSNILEKEMSVTRFNEQSGKVEMWSAPSKYTGVVIYPENLELILKAVDRDPEKFWADVPPVDRERAEQGLVKLREWLPIVQSAMQGADMKLVHSFNSPAPRYSLERPRELLSMLLHIAGGATTFAHYNENEVILARGAL